MRPIIIKEEILRIDWAFETCKCCTREQRIAWAVSNELWADVVIPYYSEQTLCLECFLRMADDRKIPIRMEDIAISGIITRG